MDPYEGLDCREVRRLIFDGIVNYGNQYIQKMLFLKEIQE